MTIYLRNSILSIALQTKRDKFGNMMSGNGLYWDSSYEIVLALMECYPDAELESIGLNELNRRIISLPDFDDDPAMVNDAILNAILRDWYEEIGE